MMRKSFRFADLTFSASDISMLPDPAVHSIWAHSHGGLVSRVALTPAARSAFANANPDRLSEELQKLVDETYSALRCR
jgi:hypothetical protein